MSDGAKQIQYSERYYDDKYEYRHVVLPEEINKVKESMYKGKLLTEDEWRGLGVQQSRGWVHYAIHGPELHIMLFRRPKNYEQLVASGQLQPHAPSQRVAV